jgi:Uma2 family endonuclease
MGARKLEYLPHYTYEEYKNWEGQWEIIYGIPYAMSPMLMIRHQHISANIAWELKNLFKDCKQCKALLPVDWKIGADTIVQPDNSVICHEPEHEAYITKAPKIIFEILSPSTAKKDTGVKFELYEQEGVAYYIIVDTDDNVAKVYELKDGRYIKMCDASNEKVIFKVQECDASLEFDFGKIW